MSDIEWSEPPPTPHGKNSGAKSFVDALRQRPGEWAKYPTTAANSNAPSQYKKNHPGTEWTGRKLPDGRTAMWARWVGNGDAT